MKYLTLKIGKPALLNFIIIVFGLLLISGSCNKKNSESLPSKFGSIVVHVVDSTGKSISDIKLTIKRISSTETGVVAVGRSNTSGKFQVDKLEPGKYSVLAEGRLVLPRPITFSILQGDTSLLVDKIERFSGKLRLLSYNVLEGLQQSDKKRRLFIDWVKRHDPDIICYQELNSFTLQSLSRLAKKYHHPYSAMYKIDNYPVGISSKYPIEGIEKLKMKGSVHGCILAQVLGINIFTVHLSPGSLTKRIEEMKGLAAKAKFFSSNSYTIFAGDFNSFSEFNKNTYSTNWHDAMSEMKPNVTQDFTVTNTLLDMGYTDSYTLFHDKFERSAPTTKYFKHPDQWQGVRYDYVFLSPALSRFCISSDIIKDDTTDHLSDHYPNIVDFKF